MSIKRSLLTYAYLAVTLLGWFILGIFARFHLDLIDAGTADVMGIALTALYGILLLFGIPVGYATLLLATWDWEKK